MNASESACAPWCVRHVYELTVEGEPLLSEPLYCTSRRVEVDGHLAYVANDTHEGGRLQRVWIERGEDGLSLPDVVRFAREVEQLARECWELTAAQ